MPGGGRKRWQRWAAMAVVAVGGTAWLLLAGAYLMLLAAGAAGETGTAGLWTGRG